jgi:hypothetical protein
MLEVIKEIREILVVTIPLIIGFLILISKILKSSKLRVVAENYIDVEKVVKDFMSNAENFLNYNGTDKKEWVKTKVNQFCIENGIPYKDDMVNIIIEQFICLTKSVNKREKDKENLL